jgi:hypothetical protein
MFNFDLPRRVLSLIARCEREDLVDKLVGLSLSLEYQSNHLRILTLIQVALVRARGRRRANYTELAALLNGLRGHDAGRNEDPAEDVFVSTVSTPDGEFKIFNGIYPAADFNLQRMLDAVLSEDFATRDRLAQECKALLTLSNAIAQRCGYVANHFADSQQWQTQWPAQLSRLIERGRLVRFSAADLSELGVRAELVSPFLAEDLNSLLDTPFGYTALTRRPLVRDKTGLSLPIPSLVSPAIRLHLAHAVAQRTVPRKAVENFHQNQFARWLACDLPARGARALLNDGLGIPVPEFDLPGDYAHAVVRFDANKLAHLVLLEADWSRPPEYAIHQTRPAGDAFKRELAAHLHRSFDALHSIQGVCDGLTLVIYDSPGWNLNFALGGDPAHDWYMVGLSAYQLSMLVADPAFSLLDMWKMLRQARNMKEMGVHLLAWPDMLNYWSIWRGMHGSFWPRDIDLRHFGSYAPDTSQIQRQVAAVRLIRNAHAVHSITGVWRRVERWIDLGAPSSEYDKPIYLDPISLALGELRSVVETARGLWWVASARPPFDPEDRRYIYLLWQSAAEWLLLLAQSGGEWLANHRGTLEVRLLPVPASIIDAPEHIEYVCADDLACVTIVLPPKFIEALATVDNRGETTFVRALALAITKAWKIELDEVGLETWVTEVTRDPALKMMHMTLSADLGLAIDIVAELAPFRLLQVPDLASASLHFRDALALIPESGATRFTKRVEGAEPVTRLLHAAVDVRWLRCRNLLRELDRTKLLVLISRLIEALQRHRVDAERSALARTLLYANSPDIDMWAKFTMSQRDAAFRAYRIAAEMAICEAPLTGGRGPGLSDVDMLAAEIMLLIQAADFSDAVRFGLVAPGLDFLPDGSFDADNGGSETFMRDYLVACLGESVAMDIDNYSRLYEEVAGTREGAEDSDAEQSDAFLLAFEAEFGISLRDAARVSAALQHLALEDKTDVVQTPRSVLEERLLVGEFKLDNDLLGKFLSAFGLAARTAWNEPPPGYRQDDVWPWFFERRLSLMLRPVMDVSASPDSVIVYGVRQIDMGLRYASTLLELGIWPKGKLSSPIAKAYVDRETNRRGESFEAEVATLAEDASWRTFCSVPMARFGAPKKLGDLDVLAISPDGAIWVVIECKWFGAARTPREVASWIQDYRGRAGDKLDRHLQRHAWVESNVAAVATSLRLSSPAKVLGRIVTTSPVPLAFTGGIASNAAVWTRRELSEILKSADLQAAL